MMPPGKRRIRAPAILLIILLLGLAPSPMPSVQANSARSDLTGIRVAMYYGAQGSSDSSRSALIKMFQWMNATVVIVHPSDVMSGDLDGYHMIVVPGGYAGDYVTDLGASGANQIRSFVESGGSYLGVCAGAYFACDAIVWEGDSIGYPLDLFNGTGVGAIDEIAPWPSYNMCTIEISTNTTLIDLSSEPTTQSVMYYGGPYFLPDTQLDAETIASYSVNGKPAMIALRFHEGRAFLSGPHPEWEKDQPIVYDRGPAWPMMLSVSLWLVENASETTRVADTSTMVLGLVMVTTAVVALSLLVFVMRHRSRS